MIKYLKKGLIITLLHIGVVSGWCEQKGIIGEPVFIKVCPDSAKVLPFTTKGSVIPTADEIKLLDLVNSARADPSSVGWPSYPPVPPLEPNINLWLAARFHSQEMIDSGYFDHDSKNAAGVSYENAFDRMKRYGYIGTAYGENIAGNPTVDGAFAAWLDSEGHRDNIFSKDYDYSETGIGIIDGGPYGKMLTHDFGYRAIEFDLMVESSDISISPSDPAVGEIVQISATIHNLKRTHAFPVEVHFFDGDPDAGGSLIGRDTISAIIGEAMQETSTTSWKAEEGTHNIWVKADPSDHFDEGIDEGNNAAYKSIHLEGGEGESVTLLPEDRVYFSPNPARNVDKVTLYFQLNASSEAELPNDIKIEIFDVAGDIVEVIELLKDKGDFQAGSNKYFWDISSIPRGLYVYKVIAGSEQVINKVAIIK